MADAGKAMMLYKKAYDSTYTYEKLDVVSYNGSLYISTTDGNLGNAPTDETKWQLFLQGGIADNIQATDTHGLVGTAGQSSFVQLLLDALAANTVKKSNILNTMEEIEANTSAENISGALAINALKINFANSLDALNSNFNNYLKTFTDISQLGLSISDITTWDDIWLLMPSPSMLVYSPAAANANVLITNGFLPSDIGNGCISLHMYSVGIKSICVIYHIDNGDSNNYAVYLAQRSNTNPETGEWNGWVKLLCSKV